MATIIELFLPLARPQDIITYSQLYVLDLILAPEYHSATAHNSLVCIIYLSISASLSMECRFRIVLPISRLFSLQFVSPFASKLSLSPSLHSLSTYNNPTIASVPSKNDGLHRRVEHNTRVHPSVQYARTKRSCDKAIHWRAGYFSRRSLYLSLSLISLARVVCRARTWP